MDFISNEKMKIYKDLARKCESYDLFCWVLGKNEEWMSGLNQDSVKAVLKDIYNSVHISEKQRLFVDMDGTLAEFKTVDTLETLYEKNYFLNLKPITGVIEAVKQIAANPGIDVYILSSYLSDSAYAISEKEQWLDKYMPEITEERRLFVACGQKKSSVVPGHIRSNDFLLDDYTINLNDWEPPARGIKILNGINHTHGTWKSDRIRFDHKPEELSEMIISVMKGQKHYYEDRIMPQDGKAYENIQEYSCPEADRGIIR